MWKDFLYFNKGQKTGIIILICLIILALCVFGYFFYSEPDEQTSGAEFTEQAIQFDKSLKNQDSIRQQQWANRFRQKDSTTAVATYRQTPTYKLFTFDPNTLDSSGFVALGLKPYVASNILKYRKKGGFFKSSESFSKVYGISPEKYSELTPYIAIAERKVSKPDSLRTSRSSQKSENISVDLNTADTAMLMKVRGIGRGYARGIVRFRNQTGGFVRVEQLLEVFGMTDENYARIKPYCTIGSAPIRQININTASVERLNAHPYLDFYESKAIFEYRRKKGKIKSLSELQNIDGLTDETIRKISPYLSLE